MLKIAGSTSLTFDFPTDIQTSMRFFDGLERLSAYLPLIDFVERLDQTALRLVYNATELGAYHIRIYTDVRPQLDIVEKRLLVMPATEFDPIPKRAAFNASTGQGFYASESLFHPSKDGHTKIDFRLELKAQLPRPKGLRFMPGGVVDSIASNITEKRIGEIAAGFVANAKAALPLWLAAQPNGHAL